jgi:thiol-disulfide isomerase/thioredoxin
MFGIKLLDRSEGSWQAKLCGAELLSEGKLTPTVNALEGKFVGLFFSATWCPPAATFLPYLIKLYERAQAESFPLEIVLVSCDLSKKAMLSSLAEMPWLGVPFGSDASDAIKSRVLVRSVPTLVILNPQGNVITRSGQKEVFDPDVFANWAASAGINEQQTKVPHTMLTVPDSLSVTRRHRVWPALGRLGFYPLRDDGKCTTGGSTITLANTVHEGSGVYLNGIYGTEKAYTLKTPNLFKNLKSFSVCVDFALEQVRQDWLLVGGMLFRWFGVEVRGETAEKAVTVTLNNQEIAFPFLQGQKLKLKTWYSLSVSVNVPARVLTCAVGSCEVEQLWIAETKLPEDFEFQIPDEVLVTDGHLTSSNLSNGGCFRGLVKNLALYERALSVGEMREVFGAPKTEVQSTQIAAIVPTSDITSVIRIVGTELGYEDEKIDSIITWFVENDYTTLEHLAQDEEWTKLTARFVGRIKTILVDSRTLPR